MQKCLADQERVDGVRQVDKTAESSSGVTG
jgi:hypothetical protein